MTVFLGFQNNQSALANVNGAGSHKHHKPLNAEQLDNEEASQL